MSAPPMARLARPAMATMAFLNGTDPADALSGALMASVIAAMERIVPDPEQRQVTDAHGRRLDRRNESQHHRGAPGQTVHKAYRE